MDFDLELPDTEEVKEEIKQELAVPAARAEQIDNVANQKGEQIMSIDLSNVSDRRSVIETIEGFGADLTRKSNHHNELLGRRISQLSQSGGQEGEVARDLAELSIKMRDLDPSGIDFAKRGPLGGLFNPVRRYFERYKSADAEIADIVKSLDKGKRTLQNDNKTLPLKKGAKVYITGPAADNAQAQCGGWTIDWNSSPEKDIDGVTTIQKGFEQLAEQYGITVITDKSTFIAFV